MLKRKTPADTAVMRVTRSAYLYLKGMAKDHGKKEKDCLDEVIEFYKERHRETAKNVETIQTVMDAFSSQTTKAINELGGVIVENITEHSIMNNTIVEEFLLKNLDFAAQKNYFIEKLKADRTHMLKMWNLPNRDGAEETLINTNWNPSAENVVKKAVSQNKNAQNSIDDWKTWYIYIQKQLGALILYNYKIVPYVKQNYGNDFRFQYFTEERKNESIKRIKEANNQLTEAHVIMKEIDNFVVEADRKAEEERIVEEERKAEAAVEAEKAQIEADRKAEEERIAEEERKAEAAAEAEKARIEADRKAEEERIAEEERKAEAAAEAEKARIEADRKAEEERIVEEKRKAEAAAEAKKRNERKEAEQAGVEILSAKLKELDGNGKDKLIWRKLPYRAVWYDNVIRKAKNPQKTAETLCGIVENIVKKGKAKELYRENKDVVLEEYNRIKED